MEVALRRRLAGVAGISISQSQQTTVVTFARGRHAFSPLDFRRALSEADVEVLRMEIDLCGAFERKTGERWITIAGMHVVLRGHAPADGITCVTGQLNDRVEPHVLEVTRADPAGSAAR
jgi:hypothetical protein